MYYTLFNVIIYTSVARITTCFVFILARFLHYATYNVNHVNFLRNIWYHINCNISVRRNSSFRFISSCPILELCENNFSQ